jgi:cystathionine gamma-synthase
VSLGRPPDEPGAPVNVPVVLSSTYRQGGDIVYGRDGNLTWAAVEEVIGGLEGGRALLFASGLAAASSLIESLPVPGRVVVGEGSYNGTRRLLADLADRGRLQFRTVDTADTDKALEVCAEVAGLPEPTPEHAGRFGGGGLLWLESPTNPLLSIVDLQALIEGAHALGMEVVVDNTFATPMLQNPLRLGADAVVHSASKFLSGHSDVVLGAVASRRADVVEGCDLRRNLHGAIPGPWEAWLLLKGIRTLDVRLERAQANAAQLAERLSGHPAVSAVLYPGLPSHPGHELARRQMRGFGSMLSFEVKDGAASADATVSRVRLATAGTSIGGVETLIERRAKYEGEEQVPPGLLRLSVGIEDVEDIWRDLDGALRGATA